MGTFTETICSYGANVVNAMASEIVFSQMGKIGRLTLLDPGRKQKEYKIKGNPNKQIGFFNRVSVATMLSRQHIYLSSHLIL